jgi:IclR family pca regulon transcriptional regulator
MVGAHLPKSIVTKLRNAVVDATEGKEFSPRPPRTRYVTPLAERTEGLDAFAGDPDFMLSLARGMAVLQAIAEALRPLTVSEAATATGLPRATARRCLYTLERIGFVGAAGGGYTLRPTVMSLGQAYLTMVGPTGAIQAILERLSERFDESFALARLHGHDTVWIATSVGRSRMSLAAQPGARMPAFCTASGRMLLAGLDEAALDRFLAELAPVRFTSHTKTDLAEIRGAIDEARRAGYALIERELDMGVRALAVPVRDRSGTPVGALNVGGAPSRLSNVDLLTRFVPEMDAAATEIGLLMR